MKKSLLILSILTTLTSNSTSFIYKLDSCNNISTTKCPIVIQEYVSSDSASIPTPTCITPLTGELTKKIFITIDQNGTSLDWAWVSGVNTQFYDGGQGLNELYAPSTVTGGWRDSTIEEFTYFKNNITKFDFRKEFGGYKTATTFFNSNHTNYNATDFEIGNIGGTFRLGTTYDVMDFLGGDSNPWFETFYVRNSVNICD